MERPRVYIAGTILLAVSFLIIFGAWRLSSALPGKNERVETGKYATFSSPKNVFESLQRDSENVTSFARQTQQADTAREPRQSNLQSIIRAWEARPGSSDARAVRATLPQTAQKTPEQTEREEIQNIFNSLIGTNITDKLAQTRTPYDAVEDTIWFGGYTSPPSTVTEEPGETETQQALRSYGNALGSVLSAFNLAQGDQVALLDAFMQDRTNTAALKKLTDGYIRLSADIATIAKPAQVTSISNGLVASYKAVGELLWNLTLAKNDEELVERMLVYNASSKNVAQYHIALITLFKANGVKFESYEPGSMFSFSPPAQNGF
jgi:hypothetical protein